MYQRLLYLQYLEGIGCIWWMSLIASFTHRMTLPIDSTRVVLLTWNKPHQQVTDPKQKRIIEDKTKFIEVVELQEVNIQ